MENMKTYCYFYIVFCAHPFEYHQNKSLPRSYIEFKYDFSLHLAW